METKKKPTLAEARQKLAEAKQKAAEYDARMIEEKKNKPFPDKNEREASFEKDVKIRSSSSFIPINKEVIII